jgi:hypothetical protein
MIIVINKIKFKKINIRTVANRRLFQNTPRWGENTEPGVRVTQSLLSWTFLSCAPWARLLTHVSVSVL